MIDPDALRRGATAAALVTQMTVLTVLCGWGGEQADEWFHTRPTLQTAGFLIGFTLGLASFLRTISRLAPPDDESPPDPPV